MKPETAAKVKYGIWGLIGGAVITMILGFAWGGWTTSSTANAATAKAVVSSQAAICVAQFVTQPDREAKLKEFGEVSSWTRSEFIEKGGWDKMPGQAKADSEVARACAEGLGLLVKK
ncbi:MAG TPA: hypothetical protein VGL09_16365 [Methylomirabilota bacterium]|jgi:hypothetical protein